MDRTHHGTTSCSAMCTSSPSNSPFFFSVAIRPTFFNCSVDTCPRRNLVDPDQVVSVSDIELPPGEHKTVWLVQHRLRPSPSAMPVFPVPTNVSAACSFRVDLLDLVVVSIGNVERSIMVRIPMGCSSRTSLPVPSMSPSWSLPDNCPHTVWTYSGTARTPLARCRRYEASSVRGDVPLG